MAPPHDVPCSDTLSHAVPSARGARCAAAEKWLSRSVHDALARWASDDRRSTNAQIDYLLRRALAEADRLST
jgi:hypothetical protein